MIINRMLDILIDNDMNINIHIHVNIDIDITPPHPPPHAPPGPVCGRPRHRVGGWGWGDINIHIDINMHIDVHIIIKMKNIFGVGDHFQILKKLEGKCTCLGWGTTSMSSRRLKVHVRYCVRTYLLYGTRVPRDTAVA